MRQSGRGRRSGEVPSTHARVYRGPRHPTGSCGRAATRRRHPPQPCGPPRRSTNHSGACNASTTSRVVLSTVALGPPEQARTPRKGLYAQDHRAPSHISKTVLSTVHFGPPVTPEAFGDSNFSMSPARAGDLHRVMIRWSKRTPQCRHSTRGTSTQYCRIVAFTHCGLLPVHTKRLEPPGGSLWQGSQRAQPHFEDGSTYHPLRPTEEASPISV